MKNKDKIFWRQHLKEAAIRNLQAKEHDVDVVVRMMISLGKMTAEDALERLNNKEDSEKAKKLVKILDKDPNRHANADEVDEGMIPHHDYQHALLENHPFESVYVNDYSLLSFPEGFA